MRDSLDVCLQMAEHYCATAPPDEAKIYRDIRARIQRRFDRASLLANQHRGDHIIPTDSDAKRQRILAAGKQDTIRYIIHPQTPAPRPSASLSSSAAFSSPAISRISTSPSTPASNLAPSHIYSHADTFENRYDDRSSRIRPESSTLPEERKRARFSTSNRYDSHD
jgi:hypothetical protein